jgi:nitrogen regulation protein NR(I)
MAKLLIVDDEPNVVYSFEKGLRSDELSVVSAGTGTEAIAAVEKEKPDAMILDVRLPDMSGLDAFDAIREIDPRLAVIVITAHSTTDTAIDAMKRGAFEYLLKPVDIHQLRALVMQAVKVSRLQHVPAVFGEADAQQPVDRIVGRSAAMQEVYKTIGRIAAEDVTVLIRGESGTGKELVARAIFHHSQRSDQPFLAINCAALPEQLLESELFGHEQGAFTGADRQRIGKFEQAHGGTLLLDEVGDMSPTTQAKVLRVLQDGRFQRVGGNESIATNVRVIAATNQDLEAKIKNGDFRRDLLYRLNGFTITLPPLRERTDDLPSLIDHFLKITNQQVRKQAVLLAPETMQVLETYDWPGNIRELQSVIKYAVVHAVGEVITPDCLPESCRGREQPDETSAWVEQDLAGVTQFVRRLLHRGENDIYRQTLTEIDRLVLQEVLRNVRGNQVHASDRLGISRTTLRSKLSALNMEDEDFDV